jgi:hypothetical protein
VQNGFGNFAGLIGPALTGFVLDKTGGFLAPFAITVAMLILGFISWVPVVGRIEEVSWASRRDSIDAAFPWCLISPGVILCVSVYACFCD